MAENEGKILPKDWVIESIKAEIELETPSRRRRILEAIGMAAMGNLPWVDGSIAVGAAYASGQSGIKREDLLREWLEEYYARLRLLRAALQETAARLEGFGDEVEKRILSEGPSLSVLGQQKRSRPRRLGWAFSLRRDFGVDPLVDRRGQPMRWIARLSPRA